MVYVLNLEHEGKGQRLLIILGYGKSMETLQRH